MRLSGNWGSRGGSAGPVSGALTSCGAAMGTCRPACAANRFPCWAHKARHDHAGSKGGSLVGQFPAVTVVLMLKRMAAAALGRCMDATRSFL